MIKEILKKDIEIEYLDPENDAHYKITPYTFIPKIGKKYVRKSYTDMGQGILLCMQEMHDQIHGNYDGQ
jgi:UDP-glucose 4-epimerase